MPLGKDLALELSNMEEMTGAKADKVVKEIVCCDYSPTVIRLCKDNQRLAANRMPNNYKSLLVDYVTEDARKLQYLDCCFDLVLEKGTLDAMLSDTETGVDSCIRIMAESARVLKEGGT
jgi:SAM-dependent methyltransferase